MQKDKTAAALQNGPHPAPSVQSRSTSAVPLRCAFAAAFCASSPGGGPPGGASSAARAVPCANARAPAHVWAAAHVAHIDWVALQEQLPQPELCCACAGVECGHAWIAGHRASLGRGLTSARAYRPRVPCARARLRLARRPVVAASPWRQHPSRWLRSSSRAACLRSGCRARRASAPCSTCAPAMARPRPSCPPPKGRTREEAPRPLGPTKTQTQSRPRQMARCSRTREASFASATRATAAA